MKRKREGELPLSNREKEILKLIANGYSNKETGEKLGLSKRTVEAYRKNLMNKLNIQDLAGLVKYAIKTGLTSLDYHKPA